MDDTRSLDALAQAALALVADGMTVGLGSGRAATAVVQALAARVAQGLRVRGVPTSVAPCRLASGLRVPMVDLHDVQSIDVTVDGADEVDPNLDLIKGLGGALVREKLVASVSKRLVVLVGREKLVPVLGSHGVLPVEVVPYGFVVCQRRVAQLGYPSKLRAFRNALFQTDNGNLILDCQIPPLADPQAVELSLRAIPGVVGTGLFLGMADTVLVANGDQIETRRRA